MTKQSFQKEKRMILHNIQRKSERGGIGIRVLLVIFTLLVIGAVIAFMLNTAQQRQQENHRKAEQIGLFGMQTALEKIGTEPAWTAGFDRVPYDGGWYSVSLRSFKQNDTLMLELKAQGHVGKAVDTKTSLFAKVSPDSTWVSRGIH